MANNKMKRLAAEEITAKTVREKVLERIPAGKKWLKTPHTVLGGETPKHMLRTRDGQRRVNDLVSSTIVLALS